MRVVVKSRYFYLIFNRFFLIKILRDEFSIHLSFYFNFYDKLIKLFFFFLKIILFVFVELGFFF
jgi:hypothetical protein